MSGPEPQRLLTSWVRQVQARWMATGVPREDRSDLLRQLLRDLAAARAAGAPIDELVATPPAVFADSCTAGLRARNAGIDTASLLLVCLGTGVLATGTAWLLLITMVVDLPSEPPLGLDQGFFFLFLVLFFAAAVLTAMVVAVRWTFRRRPEAAALAPRLAVTLTAGALLGFPFASAYGATQNYGASLDVVGVEALIVLAFLATATGVAQRWTRPRRDLGGRSGASRPL